MHPFFYSPVAGSFCWQVQRQATINLFCYLSFQSQEPMNELLHNWPTWLSCMLFITLLTLGAAAGLFIFRRLVKGEDLKKHHEVTGIIYNVITVIYSLVLAFVIIAVWQDYEDIYSDVSEEADKLSAIISHAQELPDSMGLVLMGAVKEYAQSVVDNEWDLMKSGRKDTNTVHAIQYIRKVTFETPASTPKEEVLLRLIHDDISEAFSLRQDRLTHIHSHVPGLVWMVLLVGSFISIFYSYFFFITSARFQYLITAFLTIMIGMCLFLVYMLDHPFAGSSKISSEPFQNIVSQADHSRF